MDDLFELVHVTGPDCPRHGKQVQSLLVGNLDFDAARRLEAESRQCPVCGTWWASFEGSERFQQVEKAVSDGVAAFVLPAGRARSRVSELAIAASIVALAVLIPVVTARHPSSIEPNEIVVPASPSAQPGEPLQESSPDGVISTDGFENGGATTWRIASE